MLCVFQFREMKEREAEIMKRAVAHILFLLVLTFGTVSCFSAKMLEEKLLESVDIESMLFSNYEKSMEAKNKMMDEIIVYFEKNEELNKLVNGAVKRGSLSVNEKEEVVNGYFDVLDEMNITSTAVSVSKVEEDMTKIASKYETALSGGNVGSVFEAGKTPEGVEETKENLIVGGDIVVNKMLPDNAVKIANLLRLSKGERLLSESEVKTRGFYCSQSAFMWSNSIWEDGKVKYRIAGGVSAEQERIITECMQKWSDASGGEIKFIKYKNSFWNRFRWKYFLSRHLQISVDNNIENSWASLGEQVRAQLHINADYFLKDEEGKFAFDEDVIKSEILHEMGHVLTLFHEHQRADRDKYVKIDYTRAAVVNGWTLEKAKTQYGKITMYEQKISEEYDYDSIMHYWSSQADSNGDRDIVKSDGTAITRAMDLSEGDKAFIRALYSAK